MKTLFNNQTGIWAFAQNVEYTATSGGDVWQSGLTVTPNTTNTSAIVADVGSGSANINGVDQSFPSQTVEFSPVPSNNDPNITNARIDVVHITDGGAQVIEGVEAPKRPTTAAPYNDDTEASFPSVWSPTPPDGDVVPGVGRAVVYLDETVSDSTDLTTTDIINYDADGISSGEFIKKPALAEAIADIPNAELPLQTTAEAAAVFGGDAPSAWRQDYQTIVLPSPQRELDIDPNTKDTIQTYSVHVPAPSTYQLALYRVTLTDENGGVPSGVSAILTRRTPATGTLFETGQRFHENLDGSPLAVSGGVNSAQLFRFSVHLADGAAATPRVNATFRYRLTPSGNIA